MTTTKKFTIDVLKVKVTNLTTNEVAYMNSWLASGFTDDINFSDVFRTKEEAIEAIKSTYKLEGEGIYKKGKMEFKIEVISSSQEVSEAFYKYWIEEIDEDTYLDKMMYGEK